VNGVPEPRIVMPVSPMEPVPIAAPREVTTFPAQFLISVVVEAGLFQPSESIALVLIWSKSVGRSSARINSRRSNKSGRNRVTKRLPNPILTSRACNCDHPERNLLHPADSRLVDPQFRELGARESRMVASILAGASGRLLID
jgi:hypothetical protein